MVDHGTTFVIGHRNPDMDAIASAIGYAWVLNEIQGGNYTAARAGEINAQTDFALHHFGVDAPQLVADVRPRVRDIVDLVPALRGEPTVLEACQHYAATKRSIPLLDADERPRGLLSATRLFGTLVEAIISQQGSALERDLSQSAVVLIDSETIIMRDSDYLIDAIRQMQRVELDDHLVVDALGIYIGLCRTLGILTAPRQKLILVDHNEVGQAVVGIEEAQVVEVLDHHRVDTVETVTPIRFQVEPIGSCSTLVLEHAQVRNLTLPQNIAGLLLCGILSDTLVFQSPTTTGRDQQAANTLARIIKLSGNMDDVIQSLGHELLIAGAGLGTRSAESIVQADLKFYTVNGNQLAISQVEVTSFDTLGSRLPELQSVLRQLLTEKGLALAFLLVTDILRGDSRIVAEGDRMVIAELPFLRLPDGSLHAPGIVSRKMQFVPVVLAIV